MFITGLILRFLITFFKLSYIEPKLPITTTPTTIWGGVQRKVEPLPKNGTNQEGRNEVSHAAAVIPVMTPPLNEEDSFDGDGNVTSYVLQFDSDASTAAPLAVDVAIQIQSIREIDEADQVNSINLHSHPAGANLIITLFCFRRKL